MSEVLKVDNYIKDIEEVGLPKLQEAFGRILKCEPIPLKLTVGVNSHTEKYLEICSGDLKYLLGNTLVHTLFEEITLKGWSSEPFREDISNDNPEGESFLPFRFSLSYTHPSGGMNGVEFSPQWIYWRVRDKEWLTHPSKGSNKALCTL